ncbi:MAG: redoxin domain-containing protein [Actinobacteria bacterium]|nr:redoxin domain-containing protein [Actinomycetota bacterium]
MATALLGARLVLAAVFLVAAAAKLVDRSASRQAMRDFGIPEGMAGPVAGLLPLAELAVGAALLPVPLVRWGALGALILLGAFIVAIVANLARGKRPDCRCFGQLHSTPVGSSTLLRNGVLGALAAFVAFEAWQPRPQPGRGLAHLLGRMTTGEVLGLVAAVALAVLLALVAWFMTNVMAQQGRMIVRLDALEAAFAEDGLTVAGGSGPAALVAAGGLPVGDKAPDFHLKGLYGEVLTLEALLAPGNPVLLLFTDPHCGPCGALLPEIARWQSDYADRLSVALISRGDRSENRDKAAEHGVRQVLLQKDYETAEAYRFAGTPSAVVVGPDQTIASVLVAGADPIRRLVAQTVGEPSAVPAGAGNGRGANGQGQGQAMAEPPMEGTEKIGQPAPALSLPDLDGNTVDLADFRGDHTLVLFWNPGCGFCQQMLPELKSWEAKPPPGAPSVLVVSNGSPEDNRAMGLRSPLVLDKDFSTGGAFNAGGTPMAVLVDPEGRIASGVAAGAQQVWALAKSLPKQGSPSSKDSKKTKQSRQSGRSS